jgi:hypothetical protein
MNHNSGKKHTHKHKDTYKHERDREK